MADDDGTIHGGSKDTALRTSTTTAATQADAGVGLSNDHDDANA
jgi:hypothetical protein